MKFFERASQILGMNARNLLYVGRYNSRANKRFADDKLFTKNYLSSRGIGVAKIFYVIKNQRELHAFNPDALPESFVIKPNRWFGGEGIVVITAKRGKNFVDVNGREHTWKELYYHLVSILEGRYAISGLYDQALIEERLETADYLARFSGGGLPDIRVIVFNYVPVIAMLRLPTRQSQGKANLHLGAVGVGINIATGRATHAVHYNRFITTLPDGTPIADIEIQDWNEVLLTAARAQQVSQIGYLAVDIAMTTMGIKVLELNARAGLSVQIANQIPLKNRLRKIADLKVVSAEKGVEISRALFDPKISAPEAGVEKIVVGPIEQVELLRHQVRWCFARIDPHASEVLLDRRLASPDGEPLTIKLAGKRLVLPFKAADLSGQPYQVVIAGKYLSDFLLDPTIPAPSAAAIALEFSPALLGSPDELIKRADELLIEFSKINALSLVKAINADQARRDFLEHKHLSPALAYGPVQIDYARWQRRLGSVIIPDEHPLAPLYRAKIEENNLVLELAQALDTPALQEVSEKIYGAADEQEFVVADEFVRTHELWPDESLLLPTQKIIERLEHFLAAHQLDRWNVRVKPGMAADIAISKKGSIFLKAGAAFSEHRLAAVIAHEIETHVFRLENGKRQAPVLLRLGTAGYLTTEEGLAVYNQQRLGLTLGEKELWPALRFAAAHLAGKMSFVDLFHELQRRYDIGDESAWRSCLRAKRGLRHTDQPVAFTRDTVYWRGLRQVRKFLENSPDGYARLYVGKIGIEDIRFFTGAEYAPKFFPGVPPVGAARVVLNK